MDKNINSGIKYRDSGEKMKWCEKKCSKKNSGNSEKKHKLQKKNCGKLQIMDKIIEIVEKKQIQ